MRKRHVLARQQVDPSATGGRFGTPAKFHDRRDPLALPKLAHIPWVIENPANVQRMATLAMRWLEAGYLQEDETEPISVLAQSGFRRWLNKSLGDLDTMGNVSHYIDQQSYVSLLREIHHCEDGDEEEDEESNDGRSCENTLGSYQFILECRPNFRNLQPVAELVETVAPGLMETALFWLNIATASGLEGMSPRATRNVLVESYWYGAETMEEWEDFGYQGEEDPEAEGLISPESYDASYPAWTINPQEQLTEAELVTCFESPHTVVSGIATAILKIKHCLSMGYCLEQLPQIQQVYPSYLICWSDDDLTRKILYDRIEDANQNSDMWSTTIAASSVPRERDDFHAWRKTLEHGFELLKAIDQLILVITEESNDP